MSTPEWVFLDHPILTLQDIEATLTNFELDSNRNATGYVIRVASEAYRDAISRPNHSLWADISLRLQNLQLILLPTLPTVSEIVKDANLVALLQSNVMCLRPSEAPDKLLPVTVDCVGQLRQLDLSHLANTHRAQAILTVHGGHFVLPSGAHTSHFFRLAECLSSIEDVDRLAFWTARNIQECLAGHQPESLLLIVDHPSMLVVATRVSQLLSSMRIKIEAISEYPDITIGENQLEDWVKQQIGDSDAVHCVVGVSSTGALRRIVERASESSGCKATFSIIYSTISSATSNAFCELEIENYAHSGKGEPCDLCADPSQSTKFFIDPSRYFLHERRHEVVALPPPLFAVQKPFLKAYGEIDGVLKVHIDDPNDETGRHHAFYIDVAELLGCEAFTNEVIERVRQIQPQPDLVVIPPHAVGLTIAKLIKANFEIPVHLHKDLRLNLENASDSQLATALNSAESLLIIDDLAFTGRRLHTFNSALREAGGAFRSPPTVTFFPLIAVPESLDKWGQFQRGLCGNHKGQVQQNLIPLYTIQLPHWNSDHCPWCAESREIEKLPTFSDDDSDERGNVLADKDAGLYGNRWVNVSPSDQVPILGEKSPLLDGGASSIQTLFACASAAQQARTRKERPLNGKGFPLSYVIDSAVIRDYTNETLFVVALLRSLLPGEVSDEFRQHVALLAKAAASTEPHNRWALREFLLSVKRGLSEDIAEHDREQVYLSVGFSGYL
jgi:hypothetical protein